ncbi:MAG TPA: dihydropteroate synthase [Anaerolineae bacterium]|nr:dihydropteroate synthase [Anaerolineae bacterium]HPL28394.1 dihydropteroate synthase [Anaerolineae bacterium]
MTTLVQGTGSPLALDPNGAARIIGERINPSGRSALRRALLERDWAYLAAEAQRQVAAGAALVDVNVGGKGIDEAALLPEAVRAVAAAVDVPLSIDTRDPRALERALAVCPGRPLVNSIGGERKVLEENLPIVAERGVPVVVLCMGQGGIPADVEGRLCVARQVFEAALRAGIKQQDIIFDPLVMTVGADDQAARVALETVRRLRAEFPANSITGGASNVSYGMPDRQAVNAGFLTTAAVLGMNAPITDPTAAQVRAALLLADVFLGHDRRLRGYMRHYRQGRAPGA